MATKSAHSVIRLLSSEVSSKIAAGEVIERPASVVKELVENSLDAGALDIAVEIRGGGIESIRVADNGCGISSDEVPLAFQRFATSKVSSDADLEAISTLGFRGEALPSIAAVSVVSFVTRSAAEDFGTRVDVVTGEVARTERHGAAPGTTVTVSHLFRNFPARRKFLRSVASETSRIQDLIARYALAYPEVRFRLTVDGSNSLTSLGSGDIREAVAAVYGLKVAEAMLEMPSSPESRAEDGPSVWGMVSPPSVNRANRRFVSFFVNRRWVQSRMLGSALEQAYHGFLMERRHPLAVVNVAIPYDQVDVNMHPSKAEVRFRQEGLAFSAVQQSVRGVLTAHAPVPEAHPVGHHEFPAAAERSVRRVVSSRGPAFWPTQLASPSTERHTEVQDAPSPLDSPSLTPKKALPVLRALGQVNNTYIAAEGPDGMYLIDQHAAHERVLFEGLTEAAAAKSSPVQTLLEPETLEVDARQQELAESQRELLKGFGFHLEPFGGRTYLLRGVPGALGGSDPAGALRDVLDLMAEGGGFETWEERAAYSIACHGAIRAGKVLSSEEMAELTRRLEECQQPHTCPHGRPTMIHLSSGHLEREFGRR